MLLRFHQRQAPERFSQTARIGAYSLSLRSAFAFRLLFPYGLSVMSCPVFEALADDTLDHTRGTLYVIYAQPNAIAIAEIELRQIAVQMLLATVLVDALHAALEDRVVALNRIGADYPFALIANVFIVAVLDSFVAGKPLAYIIVVARFISH